MIGYYVHHVGTGHLNRARALAQHLDATVTGLSSLPEPAGWPGDWLQLDRDDRSPETADPTARGNLHWVPQGDEGLRRRMAALSAWMKRARPDLVVTDVSVEVTLLARLHGVPVVSVVLPGRRGDRAHRSGYAVSSGLVAAWPRQAGGMVRGLASADRRRLHHVGGLSRLPVSPPGPRPAERHHVLVLSGRGGGHPDADQLRAAAGSAPAWTWRVLGGSGEWAEDPSSALADADVVVVQAGESAVADVAAFRRPAIVVPAERPFDEQLATARALAAGDWPCRVLRSLPGDGWPELLSDVAALDGQAWAGWCDGHAGERFADYVSSVAGVSRRRAG